MESSIQIRPAVITDLPAMLGLYRHLNAEDPVLDSSEAEAIWRDILQSSNVTPLVALLNGEPVASCMIVIVPNLTRGGRGFAFVENVITEPRFRRRGIGTAVLNRAIELAWMAKCYKVVLTTRRESAELFAFYEKAGLRRATRTAFEIRRS